MRLLNTSTLTLHEFIGNDVPNYAILSHRWGEAEISLQDLQAGKAAGMTGFSKIAGCCAQASADGFLYTWIDSCCIDRTSSAELSEAINSMFKWYLRSQVCYAYLADVPTGMEWDRHQKPDSEFRLSAWWTRGWTLQELIAPRVVVFYDREWKEIGTKRSMEILVSSITGISREHLRDYTGASVAQKMSWASKRKTTKAEDQAYALLGLFNVHMAPLYGEGTMAFQRLQLEILSFSEDESLFAWNSQSSLGLLDGLLADSPSAFADSGDIVRSEIDQNRPPFSMTNKGVRLEVFLMPTSVGGTYLAPLNCSRKRGHVALQLAKPSGICWASEEHYAGENTFERWDDLCLVRSLPEDLKRTVLFVRQKRNLLRVLDLGIHDNLALTFAIRSDSLLQHGFTIFQEGLKEDLRKHTNFHQLMDYGEGNGKRRVVLHRSADAACLKFTSGKFTSSLVSCPDREADSFVIVLGTDCNWDETPSVDVLITQENCPPKWDTDQLTCDNWDWRHRLDRVSKTMKSGRSVSVALRSRADVSGKPLYVLDITIDPEGKLPWPVLC